MSTGFAQACVDVDGGQAGFNVVFGVDRNVDAIRSFRRNHFADLSESDKARRAPQRSVVGLTRNEVLAAAGVEQIDIVVGGPNCQGVSTAGLRNPGDLRNEMFREFRRLLRELRPEWFVMENVPGLAQANNQELLTEILRELEDVDEGTTRSLEHGAEAVPLRYKVAADVLLAADFGVPQLRYRLFIIGNRIGLPIRFPRPTHRPDGTQRALGDTAELKTYVTVRDAIARLETIQPETTPEAPRLSEGSLLGELSNHVIPRIAPENLERMRHVPEGADWRSMPIRLLPVRYFATRASDQVGTYGRLSWDAPAYTVTGLANNVTAGMFTHPSAERPISAREAAILQGFDDEYVFSGSAGSVYQQIGNAVPSPLAKAVATTLLLCHYWPWQADEWGVEGRITLESLQRKGKRALPVLTPRRGHVRRPERLPVYRGNRGSLAKDAPPRFERDPSKRRLLPSTDLEALRVEAAFPRNVRSARRARTILGYFELRSVEDLENEAKASEQSIARWVEGFYREGVEGWRAYHTPPELWVRGNAERKQELVHAINRVRDRPRIIVGQADQESDLEAESGPGRPRTFVNPYLDALRERFGGYSTWELLAEAERELQTGLGTVYVGDLLAICDVLRVPSKSLSACRKPEPVSADSPEIALSR